MRKTVLSITLFLAACRSGPVDEPPVVVFTPQEVQRYTPQQAVMAAASAAPRMVPGIFSMQVKATGKERGRTFLNSELDYRDQRNLTVTIEPRAAKALAARFGSPPDVFFKGKAIEVRGAARRVTIGFFENGRPTGLYYYQTHVNVRGADQIRLMN